MSRAERPSRITDTNHALFAKMTGRRVQEETFRKGIVDFTYKFSLWIILKK